MTFTVNSCNEKKLGYLSAVDDVASNVFVVCGKVVGPDAAAVEAVGAMLVDVSLLEFRKLPIFRRN